jgi:polyribonucleotide nucleotidyltransferase
VKVRVERTIGDRVASLETGHWAKQAGASIVTTFGDTVVLTAVTSGAARPGQDFFL